MLNNDKQVTYTLMRKNIDLIKKVKHTKLMMSNKIKKSTIIYM